MITASIVLYNTSTSLVDNAVESFAPSENRRLYIVDNSSERTDVYDNREYIEYIYNGKNVGYGAGHNIALRRVMEDSISDYHIVLNPDVSFEPGVVDELREYADKHPDVVYMLPKVRYPDGELQYLCKLLPTPYDLFARRFLPDVGIFRRLNHRYEMRQSNYDSIMNPPCLSGCFMFLRVDTLRKHGLLFDERYFMYLEDFDFMRRLHRYGKTIYYPYAEIVHDHSAASYHELKMLLVHISSAVKYFNKFGWFRDSERTAMNRRILREIAAASEEGKKV